MNKAKAVVLLGSLVMNLSACAGPAPKHLPEGQWGGDRVRFTVSEGMGRLDLECAGGTIPGPIQLDADGRFQASGHFEAQRGGPQRADETPPVARYAGELKGPLLSLQVWPVAGQAPLEFKLRKDAPTKMVRCL